jgi:tRNA pseudouridine55 synthase
MKAPDDGILLVDKNEGETSHEVVKKVKTALNRGRRYKVGHAGTLDPFATGLLVVLLGQGTKISRFMMSGEKEYLATLELGIETDTLDPTGTVTARRNVPELSLERIREAARNYEGEIRQRPPAFSAVKHQGKRAYKLARKGFPVTLAERTVSVYEVSIISVDLPDIKMRVRCGSGTYIRSLAADLGLDLGPGGRLKSLRRLKNGPFDVTDAVNSRNIWAGAQFQRWVIPMTEALPDMNEIELGETLAKKVRQGYQPSWDELGGMEGPRQLDGDYIRLVSSDGLLAIVRKNHGGDVHEKVKFERVFS